MGINTTLLPPFSPYPTWGRSDTNPAPKVQELGKYSEDCDDGSSQLRSASGALMRSIHVTTLWFSALMTHVLWTSLTVRGFLDNPIGKLDGHSKIVLGAILSNLPKNIYMPRHQGGKFQRVGILNRIIPLKQLYLFFQPNAASASSAQGFRQWKARGGILYTHLKHPEDVSQEALLLYPRQGLGFFPIILPN